MSHASAISAYYSARANISLPELSRHMINEITTLIMETERNFDHHDPSCMHHVFQAKLDRWAYVTNRIATVDADPVTAVRCAFMGVIGTADQCYALDRDWSETRWLGGWGRYATDLEVNVDLFSRRGIADPEAAAQRAIEAQKQRAITARAHAIETFTTLATRYPAEALVVLDMPGMLTFDQVSRYLKDVFDPFAFREKLVASLPPGSTTVAHIPPLPVPAPGDDFY